MRLQPKSTIWKALEPEHLRVAGRPGLVDGAVGGVGDGLQFEGGDGLELLLRVAAELGADVGEGAVLPGLVHFEAGLDAGPGRRARRAGARCSRDRQRGGAAARCGGQGGRLWPRRSGGSRVGAPAVVAGREAIDFGEGPLEAVALHLLHALLEDGAVEGRALAAGGGEDLAAGDDLGLEERGLVEQVVAVDVVAGDLEGDDVRAGLELVGQVPLVHAEEAVRAAGRAVAEETAVEEDAVEGGAGGAQQDLVLRGRLEGGAEADEEVLLGLAAFGPDGLGGEEGRRRGGDVRAGQQQYKQGGHHPDASGKQVSKVHGSIGWICFAFKPNAPIPNQS